MHVLFLREMDGHRIKTTSSSLVAIHFVSDFYECVSVKYYWEEDKVHDTLFG